jgi:hypothetical protein
MAHRETVLAHRETVLARPGTAGATVALKCVGGPLLGPQSRVLGST